jgi:hypothetical protein
MISSDLHFEYIVFVLWSLILDFFFKPKIFVKYCVFVCWIEFYHVCPIYKFWYANSFA